MTRVLSDISNAPRPASRLVGLAAVLAMFAGSCAFGRDQGQTMRLEVIRGSATVVNGDSTQSIRSSIGIRPGSRIILKGNAMAELRLARGRVFELIGSEVEVVSTTALELSRGNLLADVTAPASVDFESAEVRATRGAFRVDRALASRVGVYRGSVSVVQDAHKLAVPQYRQAIVAGGIVPSAPRPLRLSSGDPWDRRYLEDVLELDERLLNFGRGLEAQLGEEQGLDFFRQVAPIGTDVEFLNGFLSERRSDLLIGLMIASASKSSMPLNERFREIFTLWQQDASWGLLAHEFGVEQNNLFALLLDSVNKAGLSIVSQGGTGPGLRRRRAGGTQGGPTPTPSPTRSQSPDPDEPSPTAPVPDEVRSQVPDDVEQSADAVICGIIGSACGP